MKAYERGVDNNFFEVNNNKGFFGPAVTKDIWERVRPVHYWGSPSWQRLWSPIAGQVGSNVNASIREAVQDA